MQLTKFRVRMFKSIIDSGDVRVTPLVVIVGKNESGKTSLLKALHKFNAAIAEHYNINNEWPRGHRDARSPEHVVCSAEFELSPEDRAELGKASPEATAVDTVRIGRTYSGKLTVESPKVTPEAEKVLFARLPKFVYMDEYQVFRGSAPLDQVHNRVSNSQATPEDKAIMTLFSLAGLDLGQQVKAATEQDKSERRYDLADASETITRRMASHWKQMAYEVELDADGLQFFTFVKAPGEQSRIKLEERSKGFQWFFSFDAKLLHETQGDLKNCVILLDEPGLHLHASAQRDLLARLQEYASGNTMIYTTHLPFMINLHEPDRIRVLNDAASGTVVSESLTEASPEAKLTLQAALGMTGRFGMPVGDMNLVVEGAHDYWFLTALSDLLERSGKKGLPADVVLSAAGGAPEVTYLATFMVGQDLHVVALYDSDAEGQGARDKFVKNWLTRYKGGRAAAVMLAEAAGLGSDGSIEDLFPEAWYCEHVLALYGKDLPASAAGALTLPTGGPLARRVEAALKAQGINFNKGAVAKRICAAIRAMAGIADLPKPAGERAERLVRELRKALEQSGISGTSAGSTVIEQKPSKQAAEAVATR